MYEEELLISDFFIVIPANVGIQNTERIPACARMTSLNYGNRQNKK